ncbi:hypothetical protein [Thermococcus sp.]|uniref:hypothetical protein n=1 Tax=Thermococcus sp. TaxID=35749 RepID=UPI0019B005E9|nr:hypothetical protein [Thermococcus sp.]MBC7095450.1 hypothetical protein [Thermococcus sp.]
MNSKILKSVAWVLVGYLLLLCLYYLFPVLKNEVFGGECTLIDEHIFRIAVGIGTGMFLARNKPTLWNFIKLVALLTGLLLGYFLIPTVFP